METKQEGNGYHCMITRSFIFEIWLQYRNSQHSLSEQVNQVCEDIKREWLDKNQEVISFKPLFDRVYYVCKKLLEMWKKNKARKDKISSKYAAWLNEYETVMLNHLDQLNCASTSQHQLIPDQENKLGRPRKKFEECSVRTKRRRLAELSKSDESIAVALRDTSRNSDLKEETAMDVSSSEVLSLLVEAKLTKHQYLLMQNFVNSKIKKNALPSYKSIVKQKENCYPQEEKNTVTETSAEVDLQALLNHTASRIMESQKEVLATINNSSTKKLLLEGKWGFDGTTGQSEYKQSFGDPNAGDSNLFVTSYVPLQLLLKNDGEEDIIIWKNPRPASTRYCRPIRFQYIKETTAVSVQEEQYFSEKINELQPFLITLGNIEWTIHFNMHLTMVDGKVCNALSETSSSLKCYICGASPKDMNNIDLCLNKPVNENNFCFGLSPLHSWIRFFEFFLHLSYRLNIKKWQVRGEDKKEFEARKKIVQGLFRDKLGLIVDKPKPGGSGTSNDGNTTRKFFSNPDISAQITGIHKMLIERCATILQALNSGYKIDVDKFKAFTLETAKQIIEAYPWYYLPASVHKVLLHGASVIQHHAFISIGELTEEAAESRNKDIKMYRLRHTRKISRVLTNKDLLNRLLLTSDPFITSLRKLPRKIRSVLSEPVLELLIV